MSDGKRVTRKPVPEITTIQTDDGLQPLADVWAKFTTEGGFYMLPNVMLRSGLGVSPLSKLVLITLMSWTTHTEPGKMLRQRGRPVRISNLVEWTGISRRQVTRCLAELQRAGYIAVVNDTHGGPHDYFILHAHVMTACDRFTEKDDEPQS